MIRPSLPRCRDSRKDRLEFGARGEWVASDDFETFGQANRLESCAAFRERRAKQRLAVHPEEIERAVDYGYIAGSEKKVVLHLPTEPLLQIEEG
jgi:hypothetical protein